MTVVNNSAPRTHPNDKLRYIPKSGMSRDHTRTGSRRSRCLGGVAEVRPCETGCWSCSYMRNGTLCDSTSCKATKRFNKHTSGYNACVVILNSHYLDTNLTLNNPSYLISYLFRAHSNWFKLLRCPRHSLL